MNNRAAPAWDGSRIARGRACRPSLPHNRLRDRRGIASGSCKAQARLVGRGAGLARGRRFRALDCRRRDPGVSSTRSMRRFSRIAIVPSDTREAIEAGERLGALYGNVDPVEADVIVALGGDGLMLQTLHRFMGSGKPIYGMNRGSVGFLMNEFQVEGLLERLD